MKITAEDLLKKQEEIEEVKDEEKELQGRKKEIMSNLRENYSINSLKELGREISKTKKEVEKFTATLNKLESKLENDYEWPE